MLLPGLKYVSKVPGGSNCNLVKGFLCLSLDLGEGKPKVEFSKTILVVSGKPGRFSRY